MRIGIDLGGSHISIGLVDNDNIIKKYEYNFSKEDKENIEKKIREFILEKCDSILKEVPIDSIEFIGIAVPGRPVNGYIEEACNLKVNNFSIENFVREKIDKPICTKNDGLCAGIAEKEYGNLKNSKNGIFLGLGTGIAMATFINEKLVEDICEIGHTIVEKDGRKCKCGRNGCLEAYCSMKVLKTEIRDRLGQEDLSSKEILNKLKNPKILEKVDDIIKQYIEYLSICIANVTRLCNTDTVALGGSFVHYKDILLPRLLKEVEKRINPIEAKRFKIVLAKLGNDAGIIGATKIDSFC